MKRAQWMYSGLAIVIMAASAQGATFFVNASTGDNSNAGTSAAEPFLTIQKAIDTAVARPGPDMIQIAEGRYSENLSIKDADPLTLSGTSGVEIVAADATKDVIYITLGDITLSDLKVSGGYNGIYAKGAPKAPIYLTLRVVDSVDNNARGLRVDDVLETWISGCQFLRNVYDDGMKIKTKSLNRTAANVSIRDTIISGNGDDGIDLELLNDIRLTNVVVQDTLGDDGMSVDDSVSVSIVNSVFANSAADGLDMDDTQSIRLVDVISTGNNDSGFDITAEEHYNVESFSIVNSEFANNGGDGVWIGEEGTIVERASLTSVIATGNGGTPLNITITGTLKLSAITTD